MYGKPIDSIGFVSNFDPELASMMDREFSRQKDGLELIASGNSELLLGLGSGLNQK